MRKREWKEEYETRVWNLFGSHWVVTQETIGWVYPRDPDSGESGDETEVFLVQLFVVDKEGHRGDFSRQLQMANEVAKGGPMTSAGVLILPLLNLCHDLWDGQGVLARHAKEITDEAGKARFLPGNRWI